MPSNKKDNILIQSYVSLKDRPHFPNKSWNERSLQRLLKKLMTRYNWQTDHAYCAYWSGRWVVSTHNFN